MSWTTGRRHFRTAAFALSVVTAAALTGCGSDASSEADPTDGGSSGDSSKVHVVASTDVYGDLARSVGGDHIEVTSIIDSPAQDPHSYEPSARDKLAVSEATIIILNGGGYDSFMEQLAGDTDTPTIDAVDVSGLEGSEDAHHDHDHGDEGHEGDGHDDGHDHDGHDHGAFNEHVWYSLPTVVKVVDQIEEKLAAADPENANTFETNAKKLTEDIENQYKRLEMMHDADGHLHIAITEPVPLYLLEDAGMHNLTPPSFSSAIEENSDVSPADMKTMQNLMSEKKVEMLAYNTQTESDQTQAVKSAAEAADIAVVEFSETLPDGKNYTQWMNDNIDQIETVFEGVATADH